jgi:hypothetical protein
VILQRDLKRPANKSGLRILLWVAEEEEASFEKSFASQELSLFRF